MDTIIEKELLKIKSHIIDYATIKSILNNLSYVNINDKIKKLKQKGVLIPLKKELYTHNSLIQKNIISKEICANAILGPSYISLDYALYYHGLIPEATHELTSITTKRSKTFINHYGKFSYTMINKELYKIGLQTEESATGTFLAASKEKAICDKIYFSKAASINSVRSMQTYLEEDLRIDFSELDEINFQTLTDYYNISKSKRIKLLIKTIEKL